MNMKYNLFIILVVVMSLLVACDEYGVKDISADKETQSELPMGGSSKGRNILPGDIPQKLDYRLKIYLDDVLVGEISKIELETFSLIDFDCEGYIFTGPYLMDVLDSLELDLTGDSEFTFSGITELTIPFSEVKAENFVLTFTRQGMTKLMAEDGKYFERENWVAKLESIHIKS